MPCAFSTCLARRRGRIPSSIRKGAHQTRTRLAPGSLALVDDDGNLIEAVRLPGTDTPGSGNTPAPAARRAPTGAERLRSDAAAGYHRLCEVVGRDAADRAWSECPKTGAIPRAALEQIAATAGVPRRTAA